MTDAETQAAPASPLVTHLRRVLAIVLTLSSLAWAADLYRRAGLVFLDEQFLAFVLGVSLALLYVHFPARRGTERTSLPWYDALAALIGLAAGLYVSVVYDELLQRATEEPLDAVLISFAFLVLVIEGLRRTAGYTLVIVVLLFAAYTLFAHLLPGRFESREVGAIELATYLSLNTNALFGIALKVGATIVFAFVFFGQLLSRSGGSEVFNDISIALMGRFRGGSAKIAITASSLFGSVSGLAASNIMATGVITIPLMRKGGYRNHVAAAIEAVASTGGQLMPPVMGAVAFLMAEILAVPYGDVVLAALIPAILYYVALFIMADLEAARQNIAPVERALIPKLARVLSRGWPFILPFAVLVVALFEFNLAPETAALYGALAVIAIGLVLGYGETRLKLKGIVDSLVATGLGVLDVLMIVAAAGFILGALNLSGLGFILGVILVELGEGNLILLLLIAAAMCIVLGMGMPTISVYILLAVLIAPSLVEVGVKPMAAHMFIFYFGMMSFITPPVAIAAFFAANLAGAPPMRTGFAAMRFGWTAYIVPFLFVFSPVLLLQDDNPVELVLALVSAVGGVWLVCVGITGFFVRRLNPLMRLMFAVAGVMLMIPRETVPYGIWIDAAGLVFGILLVATELAARRRQPGDPHAQQAEPS